MIRETLVASFLARAEENPEKLCLALHQNRLTYREVAARVRQCAAILRKTYHVGVGDFVMISAMAKPDYVIALLAVQYVGAVSIPVDRLIKGPGLQTLVDYIRPKILLSDIKDTIANVTKVSLKAFAAPSAKPLPEFAYELPSDREAVVEMLFTTGTTGVPKGAMLSYRSVKAITENTWHGVHMEPSDIVLIPLPLNHSVGMRVLRTALSIGASVVIQNGFTFAKELEQNIVDFGCTALVSVPASIEIVRRQMGMHFAPILSKLRYLEFGAGSLSIAMKETLVKELPNTLLYNTWGSSETGGAIFLEISKEPTKYGTLGRPVDGVAVKITEEGRLALNGPMRMMGYFNLPEESADALQGDWLVTNDLARIDEDGFVTMLGRADDIINVGGEKVSPVEVENISSGYTGMRDCAVIAAQDPVLGQIPVLFFVKNGDDFSLDGYIKYMQAKVEKYKLPQRYIEMDELPRNRMMKLDRKTLKRLWSENPNRDKIEMLEFRKFDESNLDDARAIVRQVFNEEACKAIELGLKNPAKDLLAKAGSGEVVYEYGIPVGFHAAFPRRMVYKDQLFVYISGSTIGVLPIAKTSLLAVKILEKTQMTPRAGSLLFVGNTINKNRMNLNKILRSKYKGPRQCAEKRLMRVGAVKFYRYMFETKILKRKSAGAWRGASMTIDVARMDDFWSRYLKTNKGVTASRTSTELKWLFEDRLSAGQAAIVELVEKGIMTGYAVVSASSDGKRWRLLDAIVLENDLGRLAKLFANVKRFLKTTPAVLCEITGYCDAAQSIIAKAFPVKRTLGNNQYFIHFLKQGESQLPIDRLNSPESWLFGSYEGDAVML